MGFCVPGDKTFKIYE